MESNLVIKRFKTVFIWNTCHLLIIFFFVKHLWAEYNQLLQQEETYWYQMARHKWVSSGDKNTRFFHQAALTRRRHNRAMALKNDADIWIYEDRALRQLV